MLFPPLFIRPGVTKALARPRQLSASSANAPAMTSMTLEGPITSFLPPWEYARTHIDWTPATPIYLGEGATQLPANEHGITINTGTTTLIRYSMWARLGTYGNIWAMALPPGLNQQSYDAFVQVPSIVYNQYTYNNITYTYDGLQGGVARYEGMMAVPNRAIYQMGVWTPGYVWSAGFAVEAIGEVEYTPIVAPGG